MNCQSNQHIQYQKYENSFIQMQKIGQGGFASVYRVLHIIDDSEYAVKQIKLKLKDIKDDLQKQYEKLIREAKYLAQVNHPNVIRYYQSWIEVTQKHKYKTHEEQKRRTIEFKCSDKITLLKEKENLSRNHEDQNKNKLYEKEKENFNKKEKNIDNSRSNTSHKHKYDQQKLYKEHSNLNNSNNLDEEECNNDSNTFYFDCDNDNEVVFIEDNSKSKSNYKERSLKELSLASGLQEKQANNLQNQIQSDFQLVFESNDEHSKPKIKEYENNSEEEEQNKIHLEQFQQLQKDNKQGSTNSHTKSFERRKNKSVDYLSYGQKKREGQLDKYDEIIFYLQTELCNQTLAEYITNRNKKLFSLENKMTHQNPNCESTHHNSFYENFNSKYKFQAILILDEIIKGLYHIHNICKMVHRDLKPHNIFLTDSLQVKIGDFGLVKKLSKFVNPNHNIQYNDDQQIHHKLMGNNIFACNSFSAASSSHSGTHSTIHDKLPFYLPKEEITSTCGTATYASPEQLSLKAEFFDHRADIYSLGIIILQLFHPMNTTMELVKTIQNCKKGELPKHFSQTFPCLSHIIKDSLSNDPQKRPLLATIESTLLDMKMKEKQNQNQVLGQIDIQFQYDTQSNIKQSFLFFSQRKVYSLKIVFPSIILFKKVIFFSKLILSYF